MEVGRRTPGDGHPPPAGDESEPRPDACATCGGRGWYTPSVPVGHPDFGEVVTCECQRQRIEDERRARLLRYGNLDHLSRFTFDTLDPNGRSDDPQARLIFEHACQAAVEFADDPRGWLVLTGPNGAGKTHLAAAVAHRRIDSGSVAFFVHVPDLLDHLRATYAPSSEVSYSELFDQVKGAPLLVLDGLGSQASTPWAMEKLQQVLNHRFNSLLPTVVTTAADLDDLDPYVASRLRDDASRVIEVAKAEPDRTQRLGAIESRMLDRMTFKTFDVRGNNPNAEQRNSLEAAHRLARSYAQNPYAYGWVTLCGETGVGKTHLAVAIAAKRIELGEKVFFAFVPELLDYLRSTFHPDSPVTLDKVFEEIKRAPILVLDDLGQELSSPWAEEKLYQILVHRHNAKLPTVITSTTDFVGGNERGSIASRIQDISVGDVTRIEAPDYRIKQSRRPPR